MAAHCFYIDGVKSFPINEIVFVHAGCLNPHICPSTLPITPGNPPLSWKPRLTTFSSAGDASGPDQATHLSPLLRQRILAGRRCHRWVVESGRSQRNVTLQEFVVSATAHGFSSSVAADRFQRFLWRIQKNLGQIALYSEAPCLKSRQEKFRADETFFRVFGHPNVGKPRHPSSYLGVRGIVAVFKKMFGFSGLLNCLRCKAQKKKNYNP